MAKDITLKHVLYALEYMRDALVRVPPKSIGGKAKWQMKATGASVKDSVANEVRASGHVMAISERDGSELVVWRAAA